jgi:putative methionine-R-sulfoxide reductase with GAF domain
MRAIPGRSPKRFWEHKSVVEALGVVPPIVAAVITAILNLRDPAKRSLGWVLIGASAWLAIASLVKVLNARAQDAAQKRNEEHEGLLATLHVLHGAVRSRVGLNSHHDGKLRATIHRVLSGEGGDQSVERVEQLLPYIGGTGNSAGRTFSVRSGIIGKAVRERSAFTASRVAADYEAFLVELVRDWSYTPEDARKLSPDRRSWMAVPISGEGGAVVAVVYLDSNESDFFGTEVQRVVLEACTGITTYINEVVLR